MKPTAQDIKWLRAVYPSIEYEEHRNRITGEFDIRACYDAASGKLRTEGARRDEEIRRSPRFLQDVFELEIRLNAEAVGRNGWPTVFETGGRGDAIAAEWNIPKIDLHVFRDDSFCLGLKCAKPRRLTLRGFVRDLVVPFLYWLAYVDRFGLESARKDLWGEYSHGQAGCNEYLAELAAHAGHDPPRNDPCPCGSGKKTKKCCLDEIEEWKRKAGRMAPDLGVQGHMGSGILTLERMTASATPMSR